MDWVLSNEISMRQVKEHKNYFMAKEVHEPFRNGTENERISERLFLAHVLSTSGRTVVDVVVMNLH